MLQAALECEVEAFLAEHADRADEHGRKQVVRNGYLPGRTIMTGAGPLEIEQPRARDKSRRRTSVHISMSAYTPRASLSVKGRIAAPPRFSSPISLHSCALHFSTGRATPPRAALFDRRSQSFSARCHTGSYRTAPSSVPQALSEASSGKKVSTGARFSCAAWHRKGAGSSASLTVRRSDRRECRCRT